MKQRLISVAAGLLLLFGLMLWIDTPLLNAVFAVIGAIAVYEAIRAFKAADNILFVAVFCGLHVLNMTMLIDAYLFVYLSLFAMFTLIMLSRKRHYLYKEGAAIYAALLMISLGLRSILHTAALSACKEDMRFMVFMGLALGWLCDTFAFTFGKLLGKRKLCPEISPNKTVAGAIGGVVGTPIAISILYIIYSGGNVDGSAFAGKTGLLPILFFFGMGLVGSVVGILGDLSASYIKRECGIKDFGNLMPGHGGAFDRLDSVLFTSTLAYFCFKLFLRIF